jgi:hypothetical protein
MRISLKLFWVAMCLNAALLSTAARADGSSANNGSSWAVKTGGGCKVILNAGALYANESITAHQDWASKMTVSYQGGCGANGFADGSGVVTVVDTMTGDGFVTDYRFTTTYRGTFRNGLMEGSFSIASTGVSNGEQFNPNDETLEFLHGCDQNNSNWECDPDQGLAQQKKLAMTAPVTAPKAATVTPATTTAPANAGTSFTVLPTGLTIEKREQAYDAVAGTLLAAISGDPSTIGTGSKLVDRVIASLTGALRAGGGQDLIGSNGGFLDTILGEVRSALGSNLPSNTNQLVDLAMGELKRALSKPRTKPVAIAQTSSPQTASGSGQSERLAINATAMIEAFAVTNHVMTAKTTTEGSLYLNGPSFNAFFYHCEPGGSCKRMQLSVCVSGDYASLGKVNEWNADKIDGRAYMSGNKLCVDSLVVSSDGYMTGSDFASHVVAFERVSNSVRTTLNRP